MAIKLNKITTRYSYKPKSYWQWCALIFLTGSLFTITDATVRHFIPLHQTVIKDVVEHHRVEYVRVPVPPKHEYPPLKNPKDACHGAPVVVINAMIQATNKDKPDDWTTFLVVRPAGDEYHVFCQMEGAEGSFHDRLAPGDLIVIPNGDVEG